ncbi:hypothetical protein M9Y10_009933 [Tritrichomonas musculus]|uniref:Uncharacterized protein n=1 Tax=Tritrichomonas musculus TaxID=1915356 RepID=A0ABR2IR14_9EUKA
MQNKKPNTMIKDQEPSVTPADQKPKQNSSHSSKTTSPSPKNENHIPDNTFHFLSEIIKSISLPINHRKWSVLFMIICIFIMLTSYTA